MAEMQTNGAVHTVRQELGGVLLFVAAIWAAFLIDWLLPIDLIGLIPRQLKGIPGIVTMTFVHQDWSHLLSNTVPLFVLLVLLAGSRARSWGIVVLITGTGGVLLWIFGRSARHVGASLLIFGLISYLIASGLFFERRPVPVIVALVVGFLYGTVLLGGILPQFGTSSSVSWDGHLCGAIAGVVVAYLLARPGSRTASDIV